MALTRSCVMNGGVAAKMVMNAGLPDVSAQIKDCGAYIQCPQCGYHIDNSAICDHGWPGFPAGVKFDPSDVELLDHLSSKLGVGNSEPHPSIDDYIRTLDVDKGICYTHPQYLPGVKKDGRSIYFFHKTMRACASGKRKLRRVEDQESTVTVRWHQTGKTKPVMENGIHKGFKKIMVLYPKSDEGNWVMHQFHLGTDEDEKEGVYVVSKVFYQQPPEKETRRKNVKPAALIEEESHVEEDDFVSSLFQYEGVDANHEDSRIFNQNDAESVDLDNIEVTVFDHQDIVGEW